MRKKLKSKIIARVARGAPLAPNEFFFNFSSYLQAINKQFIVEGLRHFLIGINGIGL
jgi:hypothetical protein